MTALPALIRVTIRISHITTRKIRRLISSMARDKASSADMSSSPSGNQRVSLPQQRPGDSICEIRATLGFAGERFSPRLDALEYPAGRGPAAMVPGRNRVVEAEQ